jgi:phosphatidylserine decarboxylase
MTLKKLRDCIFLQEDLNFLLTNRIPRITLTRWMGRFSKIRRPWIRDFSIWVWKMFSDLDLSEARKDRFDSLHDCFVRELKPGARPFDPSPQVVCSPCDGIVGTCGTIENDRLLQIKGMDYSLQELMGNEALTARHRAGSYVTLRLTSSMYHRFHAPHDSTVQRVTHIQGDTWNVNPIALKRVERLFCRNDRAVIETRLEPSGLPLTLVPVGAILVASIRLHFLNLKLHHDYDGPKTIECNAHLQRGKEMGWFEHGSTIIVFTPPGLRLAAEVATGSRIRAGEPLFLLEPDHVRGASQ